MELPIDQLEKRHQQLQNELRYHTEVLQKSEKYERLIENEDWQDVIKEIKFVVDIHDREIKQALESLAELSPHDRVNANDVMLIHQIRKEQIEEALKEPERILDLAKKARERIPEVKEAIRQLQEELTHA